MSNVDNSLCLFRDLSIGDRFTVAPSEVVRVKVGSESFYWDSFNKPLNAGVRMDPNSRVKPIRITQSNILDTPVDE